MAKISVLPVADTLKGNEHLPIVQGGETKRVTMAALRALITPYLQYWYKGDTGDTGPAQSSYATLEALQAAPITNLSFIFAPDETDTSGFPETVYLFRTGDFSNLRYADDFATGSKVKLDGVPISQGALVAQGARGVRFSRSGTRAKMRSVGDELDAMAVIPEQYGAIGDGVTDDTAAVQAAFDTGFSVRLTHGKTYLIHKRLTLASTNITISGGGRLKGAAAWDFGPDTSGPNTHMRMLFITGAGVTIKNIGFDNSAAPAGSGIENGFIWTNAPSTIVDGCLFIGNKKGTCFWALGDAPYSKMTRCSAHDCSGLAFVRGRNAVVSDNMIKNATDAAIALNGRDCVGAVIADNTINNEQLAIIPAMIAVEEGASVWTITGNVMMGVNGGGISLINVLDETSVKGGIIASNYITAVTFDGKIPTTTNPAALLSITASYRDIHVYGNTIAGCPYGPANSRLVVLPATGTVFEHNIIDGSDARGLTAMIDIIPGKGGITIRENRSTGFPGARHYFVNAGNYGNEPIRFEGGDFLVGAEAINAELAAPNTINLLLYIRDLKRVTTGVVANAASAIGDRGAFLNSGAWKRPHIIGEYTDMACDTTPMHPGALPFQVGDRFHPLDPVGAGCLTIVRGPGASEADRWKKFGGMVA